MDSLEGVDARVPAQQLQEFIIEAEGKGDAHDTQADVGDDSDGTELEHTGQTDHQPREDHAGAPHAPPVHQIYNCKTRQHQFLHEQQYMSELLHVSS